MKGFNHEVTAEIRSRANILEVISEHVVLKRAGKEYKGRCPFHDEKTPSFNVNTEKGIFKCFGCGEGGDVFTFVQKFKKVDFPESVRQLAHKYNVQLVETTEERQEWDRRSQILMLHQQASEFFCRMLEDPEQGAVARDYLEKRGFTQDIIEKFKLGFAPSSWDSLLRFLTTSTKVSPATLQEAGLVRSREDGSGHYDLFRNRLMIPICDDQGRVIAFGGRTLGDDTAKYVNSPETPIYTKGNHLFALNVAKETIKAQDAVIVVEGYFDAITPHQFGFTNTVATLGTALTETQAKNLMRYTESKRVYLAFDADAAGTKAIVGGAEKLNHIAEGIGIDLRVIHIPGGKDPDETLRTTYPAGEQTGPERFAEAIETALRLIDYQLHQALLQCDTSSHIGRIDAAKKLVPILAQIANAIGRGEYIRQWAMKLGLREEELLSEVTQYRKDNRLEVSKSLAWKPKRTSHAAASNAIKAAFFEAEQRLLALYLTSRDDYERVKQVLAEEKLLTPAHERIKEALDGVGSHFNTVEDLQYKLMDRLAVDAEASKAFVEIVLKVDEIRKQNAPLHVLLLELRVRLLRERLTRCVTKVRGLLATTNDENEQQVLQSKIIPLRVLEGKITGISSDATPEEIDELSKDIDQIIATTS